MKVVVEALAFGGKKNTGLQNSFSHLSHQNMCRVLCTLMLAYCIYSAWGNTFYPHSAQAHSKMPMMPLGVSSNMAASLHLYQSIPSLRYSVLTLVTVGLEPRQGSIILAWCIALLMCCRKAACVGGMFSSDLDLWAKCCDI